MTYQNGIYERGWLESMMDILGDEGENTLAELFLYVDRQGELSILPRDLRNAIRMSTSVLNPIESVSFSLLRSRNTYRVVMAQQLEMLTQHLRPLTI